MGRTTKIPAPLYVMGAGICWGMIGLFSRHLGILGFSPIQITFGRSFVTAVVMLLYMVTMRRKDLSFAVKDGWMFLGTGLCSIVFFNVCYFTAMELTTLSVAAILLYTAPSIVMVLSVLLFKERFTALKAFCLVLAFLGCVFVSGVGTGAVPLGGILAGLGAGLGYALYSIFGRYALAKYTPYAVTTWTFIVASLGLVALADVPHVVGIVVGEPLALGWLLLLGLVSTTIPFLLYTQGLQRMEAGKASILASIEPLTSTVVGVTVFHEALTPLGVLGMACILGAVVLLQRKS